MAAVELLTRERRPDSRLLSNRARESRLRAILAEELLGWCGAVALLLAFALGATSVLQPSSAAYLVLNLFGAIGLACASISRHAYSPAALNIIWALIAALSLAVLISNV
jgi:hypothetical protein